MTTTDAFDTPIPRDRWGRPLVTPLNGGKPVAYTRCTTFVGCLEDTYNLSLWQQRMVALGLADRPDLMLSVAAHRDDKKKLNELVDQAREAAAATAAATTGTALHTLTERVDRNETLGVIPVAYQADLDAYRDATSPFKVETIEQFRVQDDLKIGGTTDRIFEYLGTRYIGDVKTGSIEWGIGKIAMQLATYANSVPYDWGTRQRTPDPWPVDLDRAIIVHLPAGQGVCNLVWVDIKAGWEAVTTLAQPVRAWRSRKNLSEPFIPTPRAALTVVPEPAAHKASPKLVVVGAPPKTDDFLVAVDNSTSLDDLTDIWRRATAANEWTDELLQACTMRKAKILMGPLL